MAAALPLVSFVLLISTNALHHAFCALTTSVFVIVELEGVNLLLITSGSAKTGATCNKIKGDDSASKELRRKDIFKPIN
ncbi:hypothetical protein C7K08_02600 [Synechococcus lacustris str. Tous]|uniref:Secreted protein n=1 Tax=Synechococcus lacustris str. Tous TaxID=1910958 RepID=A0A2P7EH79_9SYNE|nr:hypothetical protein C7K08_02600 [Synechococcus lacustris str. Tous]